MVHIIFVISKSKSSRVKISIHHLKTLRAISHCSKEVGTPASICSIWVSPGILGIPYSSRGRVVKASDLKSDPLWGRRFEPCRLRIFYHIKVCFGFWLWYQDATRFLLIGTNSFSYIYFWAHRLMYIIYRRLILLNREKNHKASVIVRREEEAPVWIFWLD